MQKKPETEQVQQKLEQYLLSRYHFRFNLLTEQTECCKKDADTPIYKVISQRTLNSLCLEARARHINCWDKDVSRFVNSEQMPDYHPLLSYMNTLPEWDGKDRVTPLAQRISTKDFWVNSFHRWMLGVTAQWSGRMARCANAVAPMLVSSEQGRCKSTFCELLMPDSLKDYYTDSFELTGQAGCEQKLAFFGLINLDEYDRLSPQKLPLLKNLMQMKKLDFRKSHRSSYSHLPRMASFIGTSNRKALLTDPSGSMGAGIGDGTSKLFTALATAAVLEEALKGIAYTKIVAFDGGTNAVEHCVIKDFDQKEIGSRCIDAMEQIAAGNGNKDGYSIRAAALDLAKRTERRKILMVLSDGLPSGYFSEAEAIDDVRTAVQAARRRGLLVIPIIYTARTDENVDAYRRMYEKSMIFADSVGMLGEFERLLMKLVR